MERVIEIVSQQYDKAYYKAQVLFDEYNPCRVKSHSCGGVTCMIEKKIGPLCCSNCDYHSNTGCTVMCLGCKLGLCSAVTDQTELRNKLMDIRRTLPLRGHSRLAVIRTSKEEIMAEAVIDLRSMLLWPAERRIAWNALYAEEM